MSNEVNRQRPGGRLNELGVAEIIRRFEAGESNAAIALEMGITLRGVMLRRASWRSRELMGSLLGQGAASGAIEQLRLEHPGQHVPTSAIIARVLGQFLSDRHTPVGLSANARFGRLLSRNAEILGIELVQRRVRVVDAVGHKTWAALWRIIPAIER